MADVVRKSMAPAGIGLGVGLAGALRHRRGVQSLLFGIGARDLPTFGLTLALLAGARLSPKCPAASLSFCRPRMTACSSFSRSLSC